MREYTERSIVIGDLHIPFQNKQIVDLVVQDFIPYFNPHIVFINGDLLDCWEISKFEKPLNIHSRLRDEILQTNIFLRDLRKKAPRAKIIYIFGNHEFRFEKFISKNAKELYGLSGLSLEEQLNLDKLKIQAINNHQRENYFRYGKLLIGHFNKANKHCLLEDTEILTKNGWKKIDTINENDIIINVVQKIGEPSLSIAEDKVIKKYIYGGQNEVYFVGGKNGAVFDFVVTPEHELIYRSSKRKGYIFKDKAKNVFKRKMAGTILPVATQSNLPEYNIKDDLLKLIAWIITEGHFRQKYNYIYIYQNEGSKSKEIKKILITLKISFTIQKKYNKNGKKHIVFNLGRNKDILSLINKKIIPDWAFQLSDRQTKLFIDELIKGDGHKGKKEKIGSYFSGSEELIDKLQILAITHGLCANKTIINSKPNKTYSLYFSDRQWRHLSQYIELQNVNQKVWCVSTLNGTIITRRNGKVIIVGNSGYTAKNLVEEKGMSVIQNHTHRGGVSYKRDYDRLKVGVENFCLCDLNPPYCSIPNWQNGFSIITKDKKSDFFSIEPKIIVKNRIIYRGKIIE